MLVFNTQHNCVTALGIEVKALGIIIKSALVSFYLPLLSSPPSVYCLSLPSLPPPALSNRFHQAASTGNQNYAVSA